VISGRSSLQAIFLQILSPQLFRHECRQRAHLVGEPVGLAAAHMGHGRYAVLQALPVPHKRLCSHRVTRIRTIVLSQKQGRLLCTLLLRSVERAFAFRTRRSPCERSVGRTVVVVQRWIASLELAVKRCVCVQESHEHVELHPTTPSAARSLTQHPTHGKAMEPSAVGKRREG